MKRFSILLAAAAVFATGCGGGDLSSPSDVVGIKFTAQLLPGNETPPVTTGESTGSGTVTIELSPTKDSSGAITSATANFVVSLTGFPATTAVTAAHIHTGAVGVAGPILVSTTIGPGEITLTNGAATFGRQNVQVNGTDAQAMISNPAGFYFNVHTVANPGGVVRGQLVQGQN